MHSTFENISNFINKEKNIISIAHDEKYLSPNSILISGISHKNVALIVINKKDVVVENTCFNKAELKTYNSLIHLNISEQEGIIQRIETFIKKNISEFNPLSLAFLMKPELERNFETRFQRAFVKHTKSAWNEIENENLLQGITKMKGSGIGLTPSGDDFIAGMLYALVLIEKINNTDTSKIRKLIYEAAISNNHISRNMLFHASIGAYFKQFKDLQKAFINNDSKIKDYLVNLIEIGETSGSDMLTGYFLALKYLNKKYDKRSN